MKVAIGSASVTLNDQDILGIGGEAKVYRWNRQAIKIFHDAVGVHSGNVSASGISGGAGSGTQSTSLELKRRKLVAFPGQLPASVVAPKALVTNTQNGEVMGYSMELIDNAADIRLLTQRRYREGNCSSAQLIELFTKLHHSLRQLHARNVIAGDLNDANIVFRGNELWLIDADSMQFGSYPCAVAHEKYLDPKLFGQDLESRPCFSTETDWYAYLVLLFSCLTYVHPYGGTHTGIPTLLRRAEARHSVLKKDVTFPKSGKPYTALPGDFLDYCEATFDFDHRGEFPIGLLPTHWTTCGCGLEHARAKCPQCATTVAIQSPCGPDLGNCRSHLVFTTRGRILVAQTYGGIRYVYEDEGTLVREDGAIVTRGHFEPTMRICLQNSVTWLGQGKQVFGFEHGKVIERYACDTWNGKPMFASDNMHMVRLEGGWLWNSTLGIRLGQVLEGQTWISMGNGHGIGLYRAGNCTQYFLFSATRPGLRSINLPSIRGRLLAIDAVFDSDRLMLSLSCERKGLLHNSVRVILANGNILGSLDGHPSDSPVLLRKEGGVIQGNVLLFTSEQGLRTAECEPWRHTITERKVFIESSPFVNEDSLLCLGPAGSVYVIDEKEIKQISLV